MKKPLKTVLITGVGAIIGYGLLRSLRKELPNLRLIGTDIYPDAVGQTWCDSFEQAPYTSDPNYLEWLGKVIDKHQVDLLIPGIEQDVHFLSTKRKELDELNCKVAINSAKLIKLSQDKWIFHEELVRLNEKSRIPSYLTGDYDRLERELGVPFILKLRSSYASKGMVYVKCHDDFKAHEGLLGQYFIAQPIIGSDDEEYTVAIFGDGTGKVCSSITLQRRLAPDGSTSKAWVRKIASLDEVVSRLCSYFQPIGPTNLQFRHADGDWKLLEINPRVSSTTSIRSSFGYNEAAMCVEFYLYGKLPSQPKIRDGFASRFIEDIIVYDRDYF